MNARKTLIALAVLPALALTACGQNDEPPADSSTPTSSTSAKTTVTEQTSESSTAESTAESSLASEEMGSVNAAPSETESNGSPAIPESASSYERCTAFMEQPCTPEMLDEFTQFADNMRGSAGATCSVNDCGYGKP